MLATAVLVVSFLCVFCYGCWRYSTPPALNHPNNAMLSTCSGDCILPCALAETTDREKRVVLACLFVGYYFPSTRRVSSDPCGSVWMPLLALKKTKAKIPTRAEDIRPLDHPNSAAAAASREIHRRRESVSELQS